MTRKALIIGATGLVGSHLLDILVTDPNYTEVIVITRKPLMGRSEKVTQHCINFDHLDEHPNQLVADDVYCCLGTTMKKAGSKEAFYKVDYTYVINFAKICSKNGAQTFNLVSSMGADKNSIFFYSQVKGKVEEALSKINFTSINIVRPSLILGKRMEKRAMEGFGQRLGKNLSFLFTGPLKKYAPIDAAIIAKALWKLCKNNKMGIKIIDSDHLEELAIS